MSNAEANELIEKYKRGLLSPEEFHLLEQQIHNGTISIDDIGELADLQHRTEQILLPYSDRVDANFYSMLERERVSAKPGAGSWLDTMPARIAAGLIILVTGIGIGHFLNDTSETNRQVTQLSEEISSMREMMMLSLLEKEEATERLRAVNLTREMDDVSAKVTTALFTTLNNDENVNVRLAALDALKAYSYDSRIREQLVGSIAHQESPLVQVALAELMAALQESSSVNELQKIIDSNRTPEDIKEKLKETIEAIS